VSGTRLSEHARSLVVTTSMINVHRGAALPAARVVVVAVPVTALLVYRWLTRRRRDRDR